MPKIVTFLMFQGRAEEAVTFYVSLFEDAEILDVQRYGPEGPGAEGSMMLATFRLADQVLMALDSAIQHAFTFTPSISLYVTCESEAEIDRLFAALSEGGQVLMPLEPSAFSAKFAWVQDRFGVSWQLNLPG